MGAGDERPRAPVPLVILDGSDAAGVVVAGSVRLLDRPSVVDAPMASLGGGRRSTRDLGNSPRFILSTDSCLSTRKQHPIVTCHHVIDGQSALPFTCVQTATAQSIGAYVASS